MKKLMMALAASSLALAGCATTPRISTDFDASQDFSGYQTFAWADESPMAVFGARMVPPTLEPKIADAIRADLTAKGYRFIDNVARADFAVSFTVGTRDGTDIIETPDYFWTNRMSWNWGVGYYPSAYMPPITRTEVREYTEGTLAIDIYDVSRRSPVWHGAGTRNLSRAELNGETGHAGEGVAQILADFPPE